MTTEQRPWGVPTLRARTAQALLTLALEPEWEARFEPHSYGFRPGRSAHDAIEAVFNDVKRAQYVLDADIAKCFDYASCCPIRRRRCAFQPSLSISLTPGRIGQCN